MSKRTTHHPDCDRWTFKVDWNCTEAELLAICPPNDCTPCKLLDLRDAQVRNEIAEEIHKGFRQFSFICEDGKCQHDDCCAVRSDPFNQVREYLLRDIIRAVKGY